MAKRRALKLVYFSRNNHNSIDSRPSTFLARIFFQVFFQQTKTQTPATSSADNHNLKTVNVSNTKESDFSSYNRIY